MLKIKEWKYEEMMKKVCCYGDKWMEINDFERNDDSLRMVKVVDGFVSYKGRFEILRESEKAIFVEFNKSWKEWLPKSVIVLA